MTDEEFTRTIDSSTERGGSPSIQKSRDQDKAKGATERDRKDQRSNTGMQGQLGHRNQDAELKDADSDLPG
jgi:hypothetical protein